MANNTNNSKKQLTKLVNRVKYIAARNIEELEKKQNKFLEERAGNFSSQPIIQNLPHHPSDDAFCVMIQYTMRVPVDPSAITEEAESEATEVSNKA